MNNIRIVLVRTYAGGNIGASSRAMKNMGLKQLTLVSPRDFPSDEATKMATRGAEDILQNAQVVDSLYNAVHDCELVVACSARPRIFDLPILSPERAAERLYSTAIRIRDTIKSNDDDENKTGDEYNTTAGGVALVFGPETSGLTNDDIKLAHYRVTIPANPENPSLNLASAVQILAYELQKQQNIHDQATYSSSGTTATPTIADTSDNGLSQQKAQTPKQQQLPTIAKKEGFYNALEELFIHAGVAHKTEPRRFMKKIRKILDRAEPTDSELNLLRGSLAIVQRKIECTNTTTNNNNNKDDTITS